MADLPPRPESNLGTGDVTGVRRGRGSPTGTPRWVKVLGIIAVVLILLFVILLLTGGGAGHGPGRHTQSGGLSDHTLLSSVTEHGVHQPWP